MGLISSDNFPVPCPFLAGPTLEHASSPVSLVSVFGAPNHQIRRRSQNREEYTANPCAPSKWTSTFPRVKERRSSHATTLRTAAEPHSLSGTASTHRRRERQEVSTVPCARSRTLSTPLYFWPMRCEQTKGDDLRRMPRKPQAAAVSLTLFGSLPRPPRWPASEVLGLVHSAAPLIPTLPSLALFAGRAEAEAEASRGSLEAAR